MKIRIGMFVVFLGACSILGSSNDPFSHTQAASTSVSCNTANSGLLSVLDYGARCDGSTDDAPAFQAAFNATIAVHGRATVYAPSRKPDGADCRYVIRTAVTADNSVADSLVFEGDGATEILVAVNPSSSTTGQGNAFTFANWYSVRVTGFNIVGTSGQPFYWDVSHAFLFADDINASFDHNNVWGVGAVDAVVAFVGGGGSIEDCGFWGDAVPGNTSAQAGTVYFEGWNRAEVLRTNFVDYGTYNGTYYSKTPNNGSAWITVRHPKNATASDAVASKTVRIDSCGFDEGGMPSLTFFSNGPDYTAISDRIPHVVVENSTFLAGVNSIMAAINIDTLELHNVDINSRGVAKRNVTGCDIGSIEEVNVRAVGTGTVQDQLDGAFGTCPAPSGHYYSRNSSLLPPAVGSSMAVVIQ